MKRRSPWAWWIAAGLVLGGIVIGGLAGILFVADSVVSGYGVDLSLAPWVVVIGGFSGALGGLLSGCLCAGITRYLDNRGRGTRKRYGYVAAGVTTALVLPISLSNLLTAGRVTASDLAIWLVIPVGVSAAVAAGVGVWIWRQRPSF